MLSVEPWALHWIFILVLLVHGVSEGVLCPGSLAPVKYFLWFCSMLRLICSHCKGVIFFPLTWWDDLYPSTVIVPPGHFNLLLFIALWPKGSAACLTFCNYFVVFYPYNNLFSSNGMGLSWQSAVKDQSLPGAGAMWSPHCDVAKHRAMTR